MRLSLLLCLLLGHFVTAQEKFTISGYIKEKGSSEDLISASVIVKDSRQGTVSNTYGYYALSLPPGTYTLEYGYIGFETQEVVIELSEDLQKTVYLSEESSLISEVTLTAKKEDENVRSLEIGTAKLDPRQLKNVPVVFGEQDVVKSITLLPGVSVAREGANGFNVRGGKVDQNLILLDESTVFNSSHLFGFFSIFNSDAIKDVTLYKGGIPAQYGGRLSSVLDLYQKEGSKGKYQGNGGVGLLFSRLMLEGPLLKDKASFMIAGRRSYADVFLPLVSAFQNDDEGGIPDDIKLYFYDLNMKVNYDVNENNRLYLSGYLGRDVFQFSERFQTNWGNSNVGLRWNHVYNPKLFANTSLIYSQYDYIFDIDGFFNWKSNIRIATLKKAFTYYQSDKSTIRFGLESNRIRVNKGDVTYDNFNTPDNQLGIANSLENAFYISQEYEASTLLNIEYGLRINNFNDIGSQEVGIYENDEPIFWDNVQGAYVSRDPIGTKTYGSGEFISSTWRLLPRLRMRYTIDDETSIKLGYNRMVQNIHLISNSTSPSPLEIWLPNSQYIDPEMADQISLGYFRNLDGNTYELSGEVFYKSLTDVIDYRDLAQLSLNAYVENQILSGQGRAYGLELYLRKNKGRFTGWLSYTLSRSELQIEGDSPGEPGINNGEWYPNAFDKTHDCSLTLMYELSDKWTISSNVVFSTGIPLNYPIGTFEYQNYQFPIFDGLRNQNRLPNYFRLDVGFVYDVPKKRLFDSELIFGIYNVTNRYNAAGISFDYNEQAQRNQATQLTYFGLIPSVSWNFTF